MVHTGKGKRDWKVCVSCCTLDIFTDAMFIAQTSGAQAAASALVAASGAQPDSSLPTHIHGSYEYKDDLGW